MTEDICTSWTLDVTPPRNEHKAIESEKSPVGDIRIISNTSAEGTDKPYREDSLFGQNTSNWVDSIASVLRDESMVIEIDASNIEISRTGDHVEVYVDMHGVPDEVRDYEPVVIEVEAFVREVYRTFSTWAEEAKAINPDIAETEWFQDLETALENASEVMKEADISVSD